MESQQKKLVGVSEIYITCNVSGLAALVQPHLKTFVCSFATLRVRDRGDTGGLV